MRYAVVSLCLAALLLGPSTARAEPARAETRDGKPMKIGGVLFATAGLILIGGGIGLSLRAESAWNEIDEARGQGLPWTPELQAKYDGAESDETYATIFYVAGGATIVAGAVFYWLGVRQDRASVAITPTAGGASATVTWSF